MNGAELKDEVWRDIPGYEGFYQVSSLGRIKRVANSKRNCFTGRPCGQECILTLRRDRNGFLFTRLRVGGFTSVRGVCKLVASVFIPNPDNKKYVQHINGVKSDNRVVNLAYVSTRNQKDGL